MTKRDDFNLASRSLAVADTRKVKSITASFGVNDFDSDRSTNSSDQTWNGEVSTIERYMDRRRHPLHLRQPGGNPHSGENDINGKNDKIGTDGRNGTDEYRFPEPPSHFANVFASQWIVFLISRRDVSECRAREESEDRILHRTHNRRTFFSRARHIINAHALAQDELSIRVCIFSKVILSSRVSSQLVWYP